MQMILGIFLIVFGPGLCLFFHRLGNAIQQNEYERQRFALLVAQELDRLDKAIKENSRMIDEAEAMIEPQPKWFGRN